MASEIFNAERVKKPAEYSERNLIEEFNTRSFDKISECARVEIPEVTAHEMVK